MPNYVYRCPQCDRCQEKIKHMDLRYSAPQCGWCGIKTKLIISGFALLNRQKPGTVAAAIDKGRHTCDGDASVYATLRNDETKGGNHWRSVQKDLGPGAIKESLDWGKANGL